ncbi:hypothetical protein [Sphaerisporangium rubeum]
MTREGVPGGWLARRRTAVTHSQRVAGVLRDLVRDDAVDLVVALEVQGEIERAMGCVPRQAGRGDGP